MTWLLPINSKTRRIGAGHLRFMAAMRAQPRGSRASSKSASAFRTLTTASDCFSGLLGGLGAGETVSISMVYPPAYGLSDKPRQVFQTAPDRRLDLRRARIYAENVCPFVAVIRVLGVQSTKRKSRLLDSIGPFGTAANNRSCCLPPQVSLRQAASRHMRALCSRAVWRLSERPAHSGLRLALAFVLVCTFMTACMPQEPYLQPTGPPALLAPTRNSQSESLPNREGDSIHFFVRNDEYCEITMTVAMSSVNLKSDIEFPYTATFPARKRAEMFTLTPVAPAGYWKYDYTNYYKLGSNCARPDRSYVYQLPYLPGAEFTVTQGYDGRFSHTGPNEYATDWQMPKGTIVCAARGGLVVSVKDDSKTGGPSIAYDRYNNYVLIRHEDGTWAIIATFSSMEFWLRSARSFPPANPSPIRAIPASRPAPSTFASS